LIGDSANLVRPGTELKRKAGPKKAKEDFEKLRLIKENLDYALTLFLNIDHSRTHAAFCPAGIAAHTMCFAVRLEEGRPVIIAEAPPSPATLSS
jgi:hypothetical protein